MTNIVESIHIDLWSSSIIRELKRGGHFTEEVVPPGI